MEKYLVSTLTKTWTIFLFLEATTYHAIHNDNEAKTISQNKQTKNLFLVCFRIGNSVELNYNKLCNKCSVINVDPETGESDPNHEPLKSMNKFRKMDYGSDPVKAAKIKKAAIGPPLSINCSVTHQGYVQVGDPVYACLWE